MKMHKLECNFKIFEGGHTSLVDSIIVDMISKPSFFDFSSDLMSWLLRPHPIQLVIGYPIPTFNSMDDSDVKRKVLLTFSWSDLTEMIHVQARMNGGEHIPLRHLRGELDDGKNHFGSQPPNGQFQLLLVSSAAFSVSFCLVWYHNWSNGLQKILRYFSTCFPRLDITWFVETDRRPFTYCSMTPLPIQPRNELVLAVYRPKK